ncbi:MAG: alpha/beta hydrolase [Moraxellaceae bacterium]|nr:MAG: alpha/beta hydrolase [Moraxellaceae bacterium]
MKSTRLFNFYLRYVIKPTQLAGVIPMRKLNRLVQYLVAYLPPPNFVTITPISEPEVKGEWISATGASNSSQILFYIHGGGYFFGSPQTHRGFTSRISQNTGLNVFSLGYRLAPDNPVSSAVTDAVEGYRWLLNQGYKPNDIIFGGDSAGGGLTLLALQKIKVLDLPMPKAAFCLSPFTDMSTDGGSMLSNAKHDPFVHPKAIRFLAKVHASHYNGNTKHPEISPAYGSFKGLPPLMIQVSNTEILLDCSAMVVEKARQEGVSVEYNVWHQTPHAFSVFASFLPEAKKGLQEITTFIQNQFATNKA